MAPSIDVSSIRRDTEGGKENIDVRKVLSDLTEKGVLTAVGRVTDNLTDRMSTITFPSGSIGPLEMQTIFENAGLETVKVDGVPVDCSPLRLAEADPDDLTRIYNDYIGLGQQDPNCSRTAAMATNAIVAELFERAKREELASREMEKMAESEGQPPLDSLVWKMVSDCTCLDVEGVNPPIFKDAPTVSVEELKQAIPSKDTLTAYINEYTQAHPDFFIKIFQEGVDGATAMQLRRSFQAKHRWLLPK